MRTKQQKHLNFIRACVRIFPGPLTANLTACRRRA
nr:MAG TPA: hypothetical protein [Caudoviricetes sp.]